MSETPATLDGAVEAALAIGRLAEAVRRSPVAPAWRLREAATVAAEMAARRLGPARVEDLFAIVAGAPGARLEAGEEVFAALWFWRQGLAAWYGRPLPAPWRGEDGEDFGEAARADDWRGQNAGARHPEVAAALERIGPLPPRTGLTERLRAIHRARPRGVGSGAFEIALPLALRPAIGLVLPALATAAPPRRAEERFEPWLARAAVRMADAAEAAHGRLRALEAAWRRWHVRAGPRRASSELPAVLALLAHTPLLTPSGVGAALGVAAKTGLRNLKALEEAGVVRELTGRSRWRLYAATDLGLAPWVPRAPRRRREAPAPEEEFALAPGEPLPPLDLDAFDRTLAEAYRAIDSAVARIEQRFEKERK